MSQRSLNLKQKLRNGETVIGAWIALAHPVIADIMATTGFDYVLIDTEHGAFDLESLQMLIIAFNGSPTVPIVRVPWNDHVRIKQLLDIGAEGILAPLVKTVEECKALVAACKYPPAGIRGFGPHRPSNYYRAIDEYAAIANDAVFVMPQIEHIDTVKLVDPFIDTGVDAICIGPNDLSGSLGLLCQTSHPKVVKAIEAVLAAAKARGVAVCPGVSYGVEEQAWWVERGARMLLATWDIGLLAEGTRQALAETRAAFLEEKAGKAAKPGKRRAVKPSGAGGP
ncbi:MAG: aldolase/citrate lyase family protein [Gammaproteobacteria bacterium]